MKIFCQTLQSGPRNIRGIRYYEPNFRPFLYLIYRFLYPRCCLLFVQLKLIEQPSIFISTSTYRISNLEFILHTTLAKQRCDITRLLNNPQTCRSYLWIIIRAKSILTEEYHRNYNYYRSMNDLIAQRVQRRTVFKVDLILLSVREKCFGRKSKSFEISTLRNKSHEFFIGGSVSYTPRDAIVLTLM